MNWFCKIMKDEFDRRASQKGGDNRGVTAELAKELNTSHTNINRWVSGESENPKIEFIDRILKMVGGDITRALPDYDPGDSTNLGIKIHGRVTANSERWSTDDESFSIQSCSDVYKRSQLWHLTHGQTIHLQIDGDSMAPIYPHASVICCRKPSVGIDQIPKDSPAICLVNGESNFKLVRHDKQNKMMILTPINRRHEVSICPERDINIAYLVVGQLSPTMAANHNGLLNSSSGTKPKPEDLPPIKV
jgi:transcriptional regulator with XRE-family HTH domain